MGVDQTSLPVTNGRGTLSPAPVKRFSVAVWAVVVVVLVAR